MLERLSHVAVEAVSNSAGKRVRLDHISKRYGGVVAVDDVNFELEKGEFLTLLGSSGSGKTSTLMMVAGFETPTNGTIKVDDKDVVALSPQQRNFGVVFQGYALFPHLTALENVEFPLRMRNYRASERRRLAHEMLDKVGLSSMTDRRPRQLSGGQQQRVALARALVFKPDALLLDEPLGALDKNMRERMQYEIKELQRKLGISILFVTHDQDEAMTMSDRIAVMNEGRIVQIGSPKDVYLRPCSAFVAGFLGETNMVPCRLTELGQGRGTVTMSDGRISCGMLSSECPALLKGGSALLSNRPERITILHPNEQADFVVSGIVEEHVFVGGHSRSVVNAFGMKFVVVTSDLGRLDSMKVGKEANLGWLAKDAQLIPVSG
jgi:putative spermidine/putrescine transport system ATP-binding protein